MKFDDLDSELRRFKTERDEHVPAGVCISASIAEASHRSFDLALPTPIPGKLTILSGAQTGVDRAALDAALALGFPCGGWVPSDRAAEDGEIPAHYPVTALAEGGYSARPTANLKLADGTVVIYYRELEGGTAETVRRCQRHSRPLLPIDAAELSATDAANQIDQFVRDQKLQTLNIAGPRSSKWAQAHDYTLEAVTTALQFL